MLKRSPREPLFNVPTSILGVLLVLAAVQFGRGLLSPEADFGLVARYAFVPARLTAIFDPAGVALHVSAVATAKDPDAVQRSEFAQFLLQTGMPPFVTVLSYAFLHGNWSHVGLNGIWLLAFGTPLARRFGHARFLAFLAATAVIGALAHWICFPFGVDPVVGASAAVSGCMGAALRFAFRTADPLRPGAASGVLPPLSLREVFTDRRALSFLVVWFLSNLLFGLGSQSFGLSDAPVAWQAHVGGFLAGLFLFVPFDPRRAERPEGQAVEPEQPPTDRSTPP